MGRSFSLKTGPFLCDHPIENERHSSKYSLFILHLYVGLVLELSI